MACSPLPIRWGPRQPKPGRAVIAQKASAILAMCPAPFRPYRYTRRARACSRQSPTATHPTGARTPASRCEATSRVRSASHGSGVAGPDHLWRRRDGNDRVSPDGGRRSEGDGLCDRELRPGSRLRRSCAQCHHAHRYAAPVHCWEPRYRWGAGNAQLFGPSPRHASPISKWPAARKRRAKRPR